MPKRMASNTPAAADGEKVRVKSERSHEENQERAYIAASRRSDRSIEARVQSARMASDIHRKRTGKGFKITEDIVIKEEMYEEEEDEIPRQYRYLLSRHLQTGSADMNDKVNAFLTNQVAMANLARQNDIDRRFAESFPNVARYPSMYDHSVYSFQPEPPPQQPQQAPQPPVGPTSPMPYQHMQFQHHVPFDRRQSFPIHPVPGVQQQSMADTVRPRHASMSEDRKNVSTPALPSPSGYNSPPDLTYATPTPYSPTTRAVPNAGDPLDIDPALTMSNQYPSAFTSELPLGTKMLANIDMSDSMGALMMFGGEFMSTEGYQMGFMNDAQPKDYDFSNEVSGDQAYLQQLPPFSLDPDTQQSTKYNSQESEIVWRDWVQDST